MSHARVLARVLALATLLHLILYGIGALLMWLGQN